MRLFIWNFFPSKSQLGNYSSEERNRIVQISHNIYKCLIIQSETCKMLYLLYFREFLYSFVIQTSKMIHYLIFLTGLLDTDSYFIAFFPGSHIFWYHLHRILKIGSHQHCSISGTLQHSVIRRIKLSEIFSIKYTFNALI